MIKKNEDRAHKNTEQFATYLAKLDMDCFCGVAKILGVPIGTKDEQGEFDMREFHEVWSDIIETFNSLGRHQRRQLLEVVKKTSGK